jgi:ABC-type transport system involved in cytochrome c biogenesis ATPase subunit
MPEKPTFILHGGGQFRPRAYPSTYVLISDTWDDYGSKVKYSLVYVDAEGEETSLGALKILQRTNPPGDPIMVARITQIQVQEFESLSSSYISLGQEQDYYTNLRKLGQETAEAVLDALRDIAWRPALAAQFEPLSPFRNALTRANSAKLALRNGRALVRGEEPKGNPSFRYVCAIDGAEAPIEADIRFSPLDQVPGRIVGIIGRNAVGKTRFMAQLAEDLAQIDRISAERLEARAQRFPDGMPLFNRVLAVSYSAFDRFRRPSQTDDNSYIYCGIRDDNGRLSQKALRETYLANRARVRDSEREDEWVEYVTSILGELGDKLVPGLEAEIAESGEEGGAYSRLSSGQAMLCHLVTGLLAWMQPNTLVLFDEPETHLHPNAVASLFMVLTKILKRYDSLAIIATHSPIVVQEIPAEHVVLFRREGDVTMAQSLGMESFGESIAELTRHVFETIEVGSLYKATLKRLADNEPLEAVLARFPDGLSLNAQAYLLAHYPKTDRR